ncbi:MAG: glutathione S-transferase family protein [Devosia sp.]|nr:glutathione S-transferase family protein [Devosia sp.]
MTITLWGRDSSANVQKARWVLGELGLAYEHIPLGGKYGGNKAADYLAMNPNGLVPTLRDGELTLWESHAIVRYLAATYGAGSLWPEQSKPRALADQWTDWTATTFQPAWLDVFWTLVRTPEAQRDAARIAKAVAASEKCFAVLDGQLARTPFLAGDRLTYADIVAGVAMHRWSTMPLERQSHPNVEAWHERLRERPAFRAGVEIEYAELVGRLSF